MGVVAQSVSLRSSIEGRFFTPPPGREAEYCDDRVCLFVSLCVCALVSPRAYLRNYTSSFHQFLCMLPMAVARSSSGGVAISYVLPFDG